MLGTSREGRIIRCPAMPLVAYVSQRRETVLPLSHGTLRPCPMGQSRGLNSQRIKDLSLSQAAVTRPLTMERHSNHHMGPLECHSPGRVHPKPAM